MAKKDDINPYVWAMLIIITIGGLIASWSLYTVRTDIAKSNQLLSVLWPLFPMLWILVLLGTRRNDAGIGGDTRSDREILYSIEAQLAGGLPTEYPPKRYPLRDKILAVAIILLLVGMIFAGISSLPEDNSDTGQVEEEVSDTPSPAWTKQPPITLEVNERHDKYQIELTGNVTAMASRRMSIQIDWGWITENITITVRNAYHESGYLMQRGNFSASYTYGGSNATSTTRTIEISAWDGYTSDFIFYDVIVGNNEIIEVQEW